MVKQRLRYCVGYVSRNPMAYTGVDYYLSIIGSSISNKLVETVSVL